MTFSYLYENSYWLLAVGYWLFIASFLVVTDTVMAVGFYYLITTNNK